METIHKIHTRTLSITLILFFLLLQFLLSLDFGFISRKSSKTIVTVKLLNFFQSLCLISVSINGLFMDFNKFRAFGCVYFVTQYLIMVFIFFFHNKRNSFASFLENLSYIDTAMNVYSRYYQIDLKIIFCLAFMLVSKFCICASICFFYFPISCHSGNISGFLLFLCAFSINVPLLLYSFIFYASYCSLRTLKDHIEQRLCSYTHATFIYKFIIDSTEIAKEIFDYVVSFHAKLLLDK